MHLLTVLRYRVPWANVLWARILIIVAASSFANGLSAEPPPPNYIQMPYLGQIDPSTRLLRSFDSGSQQVGQAFPEYFYQFSLAAGTGITAIRINNAENFEHYQFQLVLAAVGPQPTSTVDLTATLLTLNTDPGIGVASSNITVPGGLVAITYLINNFGSPASGAGHVAYYLSQTPSVTSSSIFLEYAGLSDPVPASGSTPTESVNLTMPTTLTPGTYYIIVVANYDHKVNESNFNNNTSNALALVVKSAGP